MTLWRIMYESWQMECCGEPFSVGDEVRWPLALHEPDEVTAHASWEDTYSELEPAGDGLVSGPGVTALYAGEPLSRPVVGLLAVETHGPQPDDVPETVGTVRSIQVVTEGYAETHAGSRSYEPVAGERWLRMTGTCPKWFSDETLPDRGGRGYRRVETGALVELETPGGPVSARPGQ
ncbi:DUF6578 domain-containing protein [Streptomyces flavidovirens]|uniref:DUF6578 domain-containing protein n=1 Tax=Streptomyces flavidovirens TaxID=67298 RepID=UPI00041620EF|nr:DUF6578 domain-containing protein [Streptomyces flavidovirens]